MTRGVTGRRAFRSTGATRLGSFNPYRMAIDFAVRSPRAALFLAGGVLAVAAVMGMLVLSSAQAFLAINQSSVNRSSTARNQVAQIIDGTGLTTDGDVAAEPVGPLATGAPPTDPVSADDVINVEGIRVHNSIAANLQALLDAATADGINLSGWGWRSHQAQIRLRREHCGTSQYAIWEMRSSSCSPPTARPGRSQHEFGLAIDFTYNGRSISTRRSPGFIWLNANAGRYGFRNLESEPWHWSTTGR